MRKEMEKSGIKKAIENARKGIYRYLEIMELFPLVDVSEHHDFQRKFNGFYRIKQRPAKWYEIYYSLMQQMKGQKPEFDFVLDHINNSLKKCEPSFSSKLVATLDPTKPIWDRYVLEYTSIPAPRYYSKKKIEESKAAYMCLNEWYEKYLSSDNGRIIVSIFNDNIRECEQITDTKKIDFVLWQTRT